MKQSFRLLMLASMATLLLWFTPFAEVITYPFRIFVTFIHETGHALAAIASFGDVHGLGINLDGSGVTWTSDGIRLLISSAGYISTTIYGAILLLMMRKASHARAAAIGTAAIMLIVPLIFTGNLWTWIFGLGFGAGFLALALKGNRKFLHFFMSFLAIQSLLNAFYDLRTLMYLSAFSPTALTDARNMEQATGGVIPAIVWAVGWALFSVVILGVTLAVYYRSLKQSSDPAPATDFPLLDDQFHTMSNRQF
jgi:hypothetical protein